jgi:hypothetical protein
MEVRQKFVIKLKKNFSVIFLQYPGENDGKEKDRDKGVKHITEMAEGEE